MLSSSKHIKLILLTNKSEDEEHWQTESIGNPWRRLRNYQKSQMANEKHAARNHRLNRTVAIPGATEGIKHAEETTQTTHAQSKQLRLRSEPNIKQTPQEKQIDNFVERRGRKNNSLPAILSMGPSCRLLAHLADGTRLPIGSLSSLKPCAQALHSFTLIAAMDAK
jgi:hypothetical protein